LVHRTYQGLGPLPSAIREFDALKPYATDLLELRRCCRYGSMDHQAIGIALDGLETAAFHFTRRRNFYHELEGAMDAAVDGNDRLADREEAVAAFRALTPHAERLGMLQMRCRPFGRDYLALGIAIQSLETTAFHFTREAHFYGARADSSGSIR
jgi:hypothetical protein